MEITNHNVNCCPFVYMDTLSIAWINKFLRSRGFAIASPWLAFLGLKESTFTSLGRIHVEILQTFFLPSRDPR